MANIKPGITPFSLGTPDIRGVWLAKYDIDNFHMAGEPFTICNRAPRGAASPQPPHIDGNHKDPDREAFLFRCAGSGTGRCSAPAPENWNGGMMRPACRSVHSRRKALM